MCQLAPLRATMLQTYTTSPIFCILYSIPCILTNLLIHDARRRETRSQTRRTVSQPTSIFKRINGVFQKGANLTNWLKKPTEGTLSQICDQTRHDFREEGVDRHFVHALEVHLEQAHHWSECLTTESVMMSEFGSNRASTDISLASEVNFSEVEDI